MATRVNAEGASRSEMLMVPPESIVVNFDENRRMNPHTEDEIIGYAKNFAVVGQLQPVVVRKIEDNRLKLVLGYGRWRAMVYHNTKLHPDKPLKLKCLVIDGNEKEAVLRNISENIHRKTLEPIETSHNQRYLREDMGWSEKEIADFYNMTPAYISSLKNLLKAPDDIQQLVKDGNMSSAALSTAAASLPTAELVQAVKEATNVSTGKVETKKLTQAVRRKKQEKGKKQGRSIAEIKEFFESKTGPAEEKEVSQLCQCIYDYISGASTEIEMEQDLDAFLESAAERSRH